MCSSDLFPSHDTDEAKEEMDENYGKEEMEEMSNPVMRKGLKGDDTEEKRTEKMREEKEEMDEMDLDELLAELDEELSEEKEVEETLNEQEEEEVEMDSEEEVEGEEEEEIDLEDMTEEELKDLIEDVIEDMVRAGELEAGEKFEADEEEGEEEEEIDFEEEDEEEMVAERAYYGKNKGDKDRKSTEKERGELVKEGEMVDEVVDPITVIITAIAGILGASGGAAVLMDKLEKRAETDSKAKKVYDFLANLGGQAAKSGDKTVKEMEECRR